jgi:hypothetical protein
MRGQQAMVDPLCIDISAARKTASFCDAAGTCCAFRAGQASLPCYTSHMLACCCAGMPISAMPDALLLQVPVIHPGQAKQGCTAVCCSARLSAGCAERVTCHQRRPLQSDTRDTRGELGGTLIRHGIVCWTGVVASAVILCLAVLC